MWNTTNNFHVYKMRRIVFTWIQSSHQWWSDIMARSIKLYRWIQRMYRKIGIYPSSKWKKFIIFMTMVNLLIASIAFILFGGQTTAEVAIAFSSSLLSITVIVFFLVTAVEIKNIIKLIEKFENFIEISKHFRDGIAILLLLWKLFMLWNRGGKSRFNDHLYWIQWKMWMVLQVDFCCYCLCISRHWYFNSIIDKLHQLLQSRFEGWIICFNRTSDVCVICYVQSYFFTNLMCNRAATFVKKVTRKKNVYSFITKKFLIQ